IEKPVGDVDVMDHEVGEEAAAKIPEPAPVAEAVFVERLLAGGAQEHRPIERGGIDAEGALGAALGVAIPTEADLANLAERACADELASFDELGHAALLSAYLHDALLLVLSLDDGDPLAEIVRQRLFDIDVLARLAGGDRERNVPVIGRADHD